MLDWFMAFLPPTISQYPIIIMGHYLFHKLSLHHSWRQKVQLENFKSENMYSKKKSEVF